MGTLLAGIGLKDYLYAGAIAALIAGFAIWLHEHDNKITAEALTPVVVVAHKAEVQVAVGTAVAQSTENDNAKVYAAAVSVSNPAATPVPLGLVCRDTGSGELPEAAASSAPGADRPTPDSGSYDPSGSVLADAHDADAQIVYLQGRVHELEAQMNASP